MLKRWFWTTAVIVLGTGCGDGPTSPPVAVASVVLSKDTATLVPAATLDLTASALDAKGATLTRPITWASSNNAVATVSAGHVVAVAPGSATITATAAGTTGHTDIVVKEGALLGPSGGTITAANGKVVVGFPIGTVTGMTQFTVDPVASPVDAPRLIKNTVYSLDAGPSTLALVPFTLSIGYDPANLKTGGAESRIKINVLKNGKWERVTSTTTVNTATHIVSAQVQVFGVYGLFEEAPYAIELSAGDKQVATVGTAVATAPAVRVVDTEGFGVPGKIVQFAITAGNGSATGMVDTTDNSGIASVGSWTLSSVAGPNAMSATATGVPGSPILFTATGIAGPPQRLQFSSAPPATIANRATFPATVVRLIDGFGNAAPVAGVTVTATLAAGSGALGGTRIRQTNAAGEVTYSDLVFLGSAGTKTLTFSAPDLTAVNASIVITAGAGTSMVAAAGENQSAVAGKTVATAPSVKISDVDGNPVAGVSVVFSVTAGGGSVTNATTNTDASGIARVGSWTLGTVAGENKLTASAPGLSLSPVVFSATGNPGAAGQLAIVTAPTTPARNRIPFPTQPVIQTKDSLGNNTSAAGLRVVASIVAGGGELQGDSVAFTDATGKATFSNLAIAGLSGQRTIQFSTTGLPSNSVTVVLGGGTPTSITATAGNSQTATAGSAVFTAPAVTIRDVDSNPVVGVVVNFVPATGSGQVTGGSSTTDSSGVARVGSWVIGATAGQNTLVASTPEIQSQTVTFTATGTPGRAASIQVVRGNDQVTIAGRGIPSAVLFQVFDSFGNGAPNEVVNFTVSSGGSLQSLNTTTLSTGIAILPAWTLGPPAGVQTVTATVNGLAGQSATVSATGVTVRIVTFGDSNTDFGFEGLGDEIKVASYISDNAARLSATAGNDRRQLAGKIERIWGATYSPAITAVNHAIASTTTGTPRSTHGAPGALTVVNNVLRFDAEVLGWGAPWNGGEPANEFFPGPITRSKAYVPTVNDFTYFSLGTNDGFYLISATQTAVNIETMVNRYLREGLPANHFIITTLAPIAPDVSAGIPEINRSIRAIANQKGLQLVDLAAYTSNDDGLTWKSNSLHVGDYQHYAESVREWIAEQVVAKMAAVTGPVQ